MTMSGKRVGEAGLRYELVEGWGQETTGWIRGNAAGLAVD